MKFSESSYVKSICEITRSSYEKGWDEINGGNMSIRIDPDNLTNYEDVKKLRSFDLKFNASYLANQFFLVTATGSLFRKIADNVQENLGLVKISADGNSGEIYWGFANNKMPTSEFPSHLMAHIARMKKDSNQSVVMHCHPTNLIAMSFTQPLSERYFSRTIWKMQAESMNLLSEGIGIVPYMTPGTTELGEATAKKISNNFRIIMWPHHGVLAVSDNADQCFGLIETVEKAASIFTAIQAQGGNRLQEISQQGLIDIAKRFNQHPRKEFLY